MNVENFCVAEETGSDTFENFVNFWESHEDALFPLSEYEISGFETESTTTNSKNAKKRKRKASNSTEGSIVRGQNRGRIIKKMHNKTSSTSTSSSRPEPSSSTDIQPDFKYEIIGIERDTKNISIEFPLSQKMLSFLDNLSEAINTGSIVGLTELLRSRLYTHCFLRWVHPQRRLNEKGVEAIIKGEL